MMNSIRSIAPSSTFLQSWPIYRKIEKINVWISVPLYISSISFYSFAALSSHVTVSYTASAHSLIANLYPRRIISQPHSRSYLFLRQSSFQKEHPKLLHFLNTSIRLIDSFSSCSDYFDVLGDCMVFSLTFWCWTSTLILWNILIHLILVSRLCLVSIILYICSKLQSFLIECNVDRRWIPLYSFSEFVPNAD